jgi:hypothetical protein
MRTLPNVLALLVAVGAGLGPPVAQGVSASHLQGRVLSAVDAFQPPTILTIVGEAVAIGDVTVCRGCRQTCVQVAVQTSRELVAVCIPRWTDLRAGTWKGEGGGAVAAGQRLTVTGSRFILNGVPTVWASEVWCEDGRLLFARVGSGGPDWWGCGCHHGHHGCHGRCGPRP